MAHEATINVRMPERLKRGGAAVLETNDVSPTALIRGVYAYMDREQRIPACLELTPSEQEQAVEKRRQRARSIAGLIDWPGGATVENARAERIASKYGELL